MIFPRVPFIVALVWGVRTTVGLLPGVTTLAIVQSLNYQPEGELI